MAPYRHTASLLILSGIILFFLPFVATCLFFQYNPGSYAENFLYILPVKTVFIGCYALIGILLATPLHKEDKRAYALAVAGIFYLGFHLFTILDRITSADIPGLDVTTHMSTIKYIANYYALQPLDTFSESNQPPLYYALSAVVFKITLLLGFPSQTPLNFVSFLYFSLFMVYGIRLAVFLLKNRMLRYITIIGFILWPANLLQCCRISNDLPMYSVMMMCLYYGMRWYQTGDKRDFLYTALLVSLGFLIKLSAVILAALGMVMLVYKKFQLGSLQRLREILPSTKTLMILGAIFAISASANTMRIGYHNYTDHKKSSYIVNHDYVRTPVSTKSLFYDIFKFDYYRFINRSHQTTYYIWNERLRTFLYSWLNSYTTHNMALFMPTVNFAFLLTIANCIFMYLHQRIATQRPLTVVNLLLAFQVVVLVYQLAVLALYANLQWIQVRHAYPVVPAYLLMYATLTQTTALDNRRLYYFCTGLLVFFVATACIFSLLQVFYL